MRIHILLSGVLTIGLGFYSTSVLPRQEALGMIYGALVLGGALIICGLFSIRMKWHGIIGAAIVSLLGAARGLGNLPHVARLFSGDPTGGTKAILEFGFTLICLSLLAASLQVLQKERARRQREQA